MSDGVGELLNISKYLGEIADEAVPKVVPIMTRGAVEVKKRMNADLGASWSFHGIAGTVNYDRAVTGDGVEFEIGPDKDRNGGALANIAYFGGSNGGGGTVDLEGPFVAEGEVIAQKLTDLIDKFAGGV